MTDLTSDTRIYVAGHRGLVGSALLRRLAADGLDRNLIVRTSDELDLRDQAAVQAFFAQEKPEVVLFAAARVGGILANDAYPADFLYDNLAMQTHAIEAAYRHGARKFVFLGSTCIYPKHAPQPMPEAALLTGPLEPTNQWYAIAKIAGLKLAQAYRKQYGFDAITLMPTNLYGPEDNFDLETSHVLPALLRKFVEAKARGDETVEIWGTGKPRREFLHVDDLADATLYLTRRYSGVEPVNVGVGQDISIAELAELIAEVVGFEGTLTYDTSKPDGTPRKLVDVRKLHELGWQAKITLRAGIEDTLAWYTAQEEY